MKIDRLNNFDSLRVFAALLVIYGHAFALSGERSPGLLGNSVQTLGVKIFFAMSGFLIATSWLNQPRFKSFLWRRSLRIFPALWVVVILTACVLGPLVSTLDTASYFFNRTFLVYLLNAVLLVSYGLPGVFEQNRYPSAVNGSLWSLPAEFAMYLLTPVLTWMDRLHGWVLGGVALASSVFGAWAMTTPHASPPVIWGTNLLSLAEVAPYFLTGAWLASPRRVRHPDLQVAIAGLACILLIQVPVALQQVGLSFCLPYAVLAIALAPGPVFPRGGRFGDLSYGLYLYGFPIQQVVSLIIGPAVQTWQIVTYAVPPTLLLAWASWHLLEKRALALKSWRNKVSVHPPRTETETTT